MFNDPTPGTLRVRLCLDIDYALNGETAGDMLARLQRMCERCIGEGMLTGESTAEVDSHAISIVVQPELLSEEALAEYMTQRINDGLLAVDDVPARLARYGLMEPHAFIAEMRERMELEGASCALAPATPEPVSPRGAPDDRGAAIQAPLTGHTLALRTFAGFGVGDQDVEFEDLDSAMRAFLHTLRSRNPRLQLDGRTVLELDPQAGFAPLFTGDDGAIAAAYERLAPTAPRVAASASQCEGPR